LTFELRNRSVQFQNFILSEENFIAFSFTSIIHLQALQLKRAMLNVIIIDSRPILRFGMKYYLENKISAIQIEEFADVHESRSSSFAYPHIIFVGISDQQTDVQIVSKINKQYSQSKLIVYDPHGQAESAVKFLRAGAKGYLSQKFNYDLLKKCCETILAGKFYIDSNELDSVLQYLIHDDISITHFYKVLPLTPRQNEIALLMAQGMGTCRIAEKLGLQASTISTVKSTIYNKLNIDSIIDLNKLIYNKSYAIKNFPSLDS
jgi:two-component system invasion response regulator UvrY